MWEYDAVGNRLHENGTAGTTTYVTDVTNQYVSVSSVPTVAYSARGDMTQFGNWAYTYDAQGNMIRAHNSQSNTLAKYWRDAFAHRAVKDVDGNKTVFFNVGTTQLEAFDVTNATASSTIHEPGIDRPLAQVSASGAVTFYHQDWLGNVVLLTSTAGAKVQSYTYDVWGKASGFDASGSSISASAFVSRFLYTAREYDVESGLYHYRARAYSPAMGRFLQTDPIDFGGGDVNMLRYVSNNPVNTVDPLGLWGINDCWSTPFPPHEPINIPNPNPPGTPGDFPPAGDGGGTRAWDHGRNGGSRGREFVTGVLTTIGGIGAMVGGAALTGSTYGVGGAIGVGAMIAGATSFGLGLATMTHAISPGAQGVGTPTGGIPQGPIELAGAFTGNSQIQSTAAWGDVALAFATPPSWGGRLALANQIQSSEMVIIEP